MPDGSYSSGVKSTMSRIDPTATAALFPIYFDLRRYLFLIVGMLCLYLPSYESSSPGTWGKNLITYAPLVLLILFDGLYRDCSKANEAVDKLLFVIKLCITDPSRVCPNLQIRTLVSLLQFTGASLPQLCSVASYLDDLVSIFESRQHNHNEKTAPHLPIRSEISLRQYKLMADSDPLHILSQA